MSTSDVAVGRQAPPPAQAEATTAVRGGLLLMVGKVVHVVAGFGLYFFLLLILTRTLGDVAGTAAFGIWGTTLSIINPLNMTFAAGTLQLVSRWSAHQGDADAAFFPIRRAQVILVLGVFAAFQLLAPLLAQWLLNDPSYTPYLRLAGLIPVFYALRCVYQGYLNGVKRFTAQAWLDIGASTARMTLVLAGVALGYGAMGAIGGFVAAAALLWLIAAFWVRPARPEASADVSYVDLYGFQAKVMVLTLATYALTSIDLISVKALAASDPVVADRYAGYYTSAKTLAQVPMSLVVALIYVMFPYVARGEDGADVDVAGIIRQGMRTMLLLLVPVTAVLAANPYETITLVFGSIPDTLREAGDAPDLVSAPFLFLALAYGFYALLLACSTLLTAGGRPGVSLWLMLATVVLSVAATRVLTGPGDPGGAAVGITLGFGVGLAAGAILLLRYHAGCLPWGNALRILSCGGIVYAVGVAVPTTGLLVAVEDAALIGLFALLAWASREITIGEVRGLLAALLGRGSASDRRGGSPG